MNAAIVTARKGAKDKNLWEVDGKPLVEYPIRAAWLSTHIQEVYVTTDSPGVKMVAEEIGCQIINRPTHLSGSFTNHGDVIKHAVHKTPSKYQNIVVLLGNTVMIDADDINTALILLDERPEIDSVMTVADMRDNHPIRMHTLTPDGYLRSYLRSYEASTNRQDYEPIFQFDGGLWAFRREMVDQRNQRIQPWWWMGETCLPIIRPWTPIRDVHDELELEFSEWWVRRDNDN